MIKTVLKAILLWFTVIFTMCYISAVDSLSLTGLFTGLVVCVGLIFSCKAIVRNGYELNRLLGNRLLNRIIR